MRKRIITLLVILTLIVSNSITSFAAIKEMPDGQKFDAEYYAEQNPDVVKALGKTEKALYKHYIDYGKAEGRLPYADAPKQVSDTKSNKNSNASEKASNKREANKTPADTTRTSQTVYITNTGKKYHNAGCRYLKSSEIAISLDDAKAKGYEACKSCH